MMHGLKLAGKRQPPSARGYGLGCRRHGGCDSGGLRCGANVRLQQQRLQELLDCGALAEKCSLDAPHTRVTHCGGGEKGCVACGWGCGGGSGKSG